MKNPNEELAKMERELEAMIMTMAEVISAATNTRPGLRAGLALLTAQNKIAEACSAVSAARQLVL